MAKPVITSVPAAPSGGGATVTILGNTFTASPLPRVSIGGGDVLVNSATVNSITVTPPPHPPGNVDVRVFNADDPGNPSDLSALAVMFFQDPTIQNINGGTPAFGPTVGGTALQLNGSFFSGATAVIFRQEGVPDFTVQLTPPASSTQTVINVTTPGTTQPGTANILIANPVTPNSAPSQNAQFTYEPPILNRNPNPPTPSPLSTSVGPTQGATSVSITGKNLVQGTVSFGSAAGTVVGTPTDTQITATSPSHSAGAVDVRVSNSQCGSGACTVDRFFFMPPTIAGVFPNSGPHGTAQNVTITASPPSNFTGVTAVRIGGNSITTFTVGTGGSTITVQVPTTSSAGVVDVILEHPQGNSQPAPVARYFYT